MDLALLVLRLVVGLFFVGHGAQKLFGTFGGHGIHGTAGFFESIGITPGKRNAQAAGWSEFLGGALLALGLFTPLAALLIISVMTTAILSVHVKNGPWVTESGYEYNLVLIASAFVVAANPGDWSLDAAFGLGEIHGTAFALGALVLGVIGGYLALVAGRAGSAPASPPTPAAEAPVAGADTRFERESPVEAIEIVVEEIRRPR
jgi:putative oxidoreductase